MQPYIELYGRTKFIIPFKNFILELHNKYISEELIVIALLVFNLLIKSDFFTI